MAGLGGADGVLAADVSLAALVDAQVHDLMRLAAARLVAGADSPLDVADGAPLTAPRDVLRRADRVGVLGLFLAAGEHRLGPLGAERVDAGAGRRRLLPFGAEPLAVVTGLGDAIVIHAMTAHGLLLGVVLERGEDLIEIAGGVGA